MRDNKADPCNDANLTFYMQTYVDQDYAFYRAEKIRKFYPNARFLVRSDGGGRGIHPWTALSVQFFDEERLFPIANGGRVVQRMLELYLDKPTAYLIKIDPDTVFHRRMNYLPVQNGIFGTVQGTRESQSIQGGFIGLTRNAAEKILLSGMLLGTVLKTPRLSKTVYMAFLHRRAERCGLSSFDTILGWAASILGLGIYNFSEVCCHWKNPPENLCKKYAVTHPDPKRDLWR